MLPESLQALRLNCCLSAMVSKPTGDFKYFMQWLKQKNLISHASQVCLSIFIMKQTNKNNNLYFFVIAHCAQAGAFAADWALFC